MSSIWDFIHPGSTTTSANGVLQYQLQKIEVFYVEIPSLRANRTIADLRVSKACRHPNATGSQEIKDAEEFISPSNETSIKP
jgi:hypothetical protein